MHASDARKLTESNFVKAAGLKHLNIIEQVAKIGGSTVELSDVSDDEARALKSLGYDLGYVIVGFWMNCKYKDKCFTVSW